MLDTTEYQSHLPRNLTNVMMIKSGSLPQQMSGIALPSKQDVDVFVGFATQCLDCLGKSTLLYLIVLIAHLYHAKCRNLVT